MLNIIIIFAFIAALIPTAVFLTNMKRYRPARDIIKGRPVPIPQISVLIPARNEEKSIKNALDSVLANKGADFEIIVGNDGSDDRTAEIVQEVAETHRDRSVRLINIPKLPDGWNGKQHACWNLAREAKHPTLLFVDADVRLAPDALRRMSSFLTESGAALISGIPRQETVSFGERLVIPLIHFLLLGFLPLRRMRNSTHPAYSSGIGQLFMAKRDAYFSAGGHRAIRETRHDGLRLPKAFRTVGLMTDLFDATDVATCRMYRKSSEVWWGFVKNADEGIAKMPLIIPVTILLFSGQILPFLLLLMAPSLDLLQIGLVLATVTTALIPRFVAARRFDGPSEGPLFHPLGIFVVLAIQWHALIRKVLNQPASWKGRTYETAEN